MCRLVEWYFSALRCGKGGDLELVFCFVDGVEGVLLWRRRV